MNNDTIQVKLEILIKKYKDKVEEKKQINRKLQNDYLEGIILAYEDVINDLIKIK